MSILQQGTIQKTFTNLVRGRNLYSFTLRGQQGFFRTGETPCPMKEGTYVQFEVDDKNNVSMATLTASEKRAPEPMSTEQAVTKAASYVASKDEYWTRKEERDVETQKVIQFQAARNSAIAAIVGAVSQGVIELPKTKGKSYDAYMAYIDDLTQRYFADAKTQGHVDSTNEAEASPTAAAEASSDDRE